MILEQYFRVLDNHIDKLYVACGSLNQGNQITRKANMYNEKRGSDCLIITKKRQKKQAADQP